MYTTILFLHVLGATIWTGGHLVLSLTILPRTLRTRDLTLLQDFEAGYEKIGIPALLVQVVTGLWLAYRMLPDVGAWFGGGSPVSTLIQIKLGLLALTIALALDARLRIIPRLEESRLNGLAWHIVAITIVSVLFVLAGVGVRTGLL